MSTFVRGARVKEPEKSLKCDDALFVALDLFHKENPGPFSGDWLKRCARAWVAYEISSAHKPEGGK